MAAVGRTITALAVAIVASLSFTVSGAPAATTKEKIAALVDDAIANRGLNAVLLQVTRDGKPFMTRAWGESMTGVPATTDMRFRNGAVAISYMSTLLLRLVDQGKVRLDDKVSKWLPDLRDADRITLRMLAGMSAGYHDYEQDPGLDAAFYANPFAAFTTQDQLRLMLREPLQFEPGTNWSYSHSNYVVLGLALEKITGTSLQKALRRQVLRPLGLTETVASQTAAMPAPVLHAFSAERRLVLGIPAGTPFLEESTFWNPAWTLARGSVQTTSLRDLTRTAIGIGTGRLLSRASYRTMIDPRIGFGRAQEGCERCRTLSPRYGYGLGVVRNGSWILQNPLFGGYGAIESYLPSKRISIALVYTLDEEGFDDQGNYTTYPARLYSEIGTLLAPRDPPVQGTR